MEEPLYITTEPLKPGLDYYYLRAEGIKFIQELTGAFWTDFNEHDPGVTILEQLCFALTDLSYRADFEIQDHFFNKNNNDFNFLQPHEIFPCNALTVNDYRKLFFDSVFELSNVWVIPLLPEKSSINGLYKILLDVNSQVKGQKGIDEVIQKAKEVYYNNRNICEDIEEITVLTTLPVSFHANIEINGKVDGESILAQIYFRLNQYLSPEIRFYSLEELLSIGYTTDEIFNGPLLKHGFIRTEELQPKPSRILISDLIKIIMQIDGIVSVKNLYLKVEGEIFENQIEIPEEKLPKLVIPVTESTERNVNFYRGSVQYKNIDSNLVRRKLNELMSVSKRVYRLNEEYIEIPVGEAVDLEEYVSIQNDFPLVYGIGEYGIPNNPDSKRKAQAKQLKGYLLLFEQIMANYLSQLAHVRDLFSLNANIRQTYFYQSLEKTVPDVRSLLKQKKYQFIEQNGFPEYENFLSYETGLSELVTMKDNYTDRRNRFLDYLLAIHGESYTQYSLSQFNYYFNEEDFEKHLILNKTRLLKSLPFINKNRAKAFNYTRPSLDTDNITGLETKISLLLGLGIGDTTEDTVSEYRAHSLINIFSKHGLKLIKSDATKFRRKAWDNEGKLKDTTLSDDVISRTFDYIDIEEANIEKLSEAERKDLLQKTLLFRSGLITELFLSEGLNAELYKTGSVQAENGKTKWYLLFKHTEAEEWLEIGVFNSETEVVDCLKLLLLFIRSLNIETEGLHILEHVLLRPQLDDTRYGIFMLDQEGNPLLKSTRLYTFYERKKIIEELKAYIGYYENYSVEATREKDFEVHFKTSDGQHSFISVKAKASVEETHQDMEDLYKLMSDQFSIIPYKNKIGRYIKYYEGDDLIDEDFFSYQASILIPNWSARFANKEFRVIAEDMITENSPANVAVRILWLDPDAMEEFEKKYYEWLNEKAKPTPSKEQLDILNNQLALLLSSYYTSNEKTS